MIQSLMLTMTILASGLTPNRSIFTTKTTVLIFIRFFFMCITILKEPDLNNPELKTSTPVLEHLKRKLIAFHPLAFIC